MSKIPAYSYERISSEVQSDGMSLEYQGQTAKAYADAHGLDIVKTFSIIESASKAGRVVFNAMISEALENGVQDLLFKSVDRLSRNYADLVRLEQLVNEGRLRLHIYHENKLFDINMSHAERFVWGIQIAVAKQLSDKLSDDNKKINLYKAKHGLAPQKPPYGYLFVKKPERAFVIDEERRHVIDYLFAEFDKKQSLDTVAAKMNALGYRNNHGAAWSKQRVAMVIRNIFYTGSFVHKGVIQQGTHPAYTTLEKYEERLRIRSKHELQRKRGRDFAYNNLFRCGRCNKVFTGDDVTNRRGSTYTYYMHRCSHEGGRQFSLKAEHVDAILDDIFSNIGGVLVPFNELLSAVWEDYQSQAGAHEGIILERQRSITARIAQLRTQKNNLIFIASRPENADLRDDILGQVRQMQAELEQMERAKLKMELRRDDEVIEFGTITRRLNAIPGAFLAGTPEQRRVIARAFFDSIHVMSLKEDEKLNQLALEFEKQPLTRFLVQRSINSIIIPVFFRNFLSLLLNEELHRVAMEFQLSPSRRRAELLHEHKAALVRACSSLNRWFRAVA